MDLWRHWFTISLSPRFNWQMRPLLCLLFPLLSEVSPRLSNFSVWLLHYVHFCLGRLPRVITKRYQDPRYVFSRKGFSFRLQTAIALHRPSPVTISIG